MTVSLTKGGNVSPRKQHAPLVRVLARMGRTLVGALLLLLGTALLVLPGPGVLVLAAGLAVLSVDHRWARTLLVRGRNRLAGARRKAATHRPAWFRKRSEASIN